VIELSRRRGAKTILTTTNTVASIAAWMDPGLKIWAEAVSYKKSK
jgi:hypothetical protein